jgi:hypothetical protein
MSRPFYFLFCSLTREPFTISSTPRAVAIHATHGARQVRRGGEDEDDVPGRSGHAFILPVQNFLRSGRLVVGDFWEQERKRDATAKLERVVHARLVDGPRKQLARASIGKCAAGA